MARSTFITFRGVSDVCVNYRILEDDPEGGLVLEWWFDPEDAERFADVTAAEDQAVSDLVAGRYDPADDDFADLSLSEALRNGA